MVDNDRSTRSQQLVHSIEASNYFIFHGQQPTYAAALKDIETSKADMVLVIPRHFSSDHTRTATAKQQAVQAASAPQVLIATNADYPAIVDLDGDGDLDILTFGVLGTFIEKHRNLSVERFGHRDSLVFEKTDPCWGRVAESEENNAMYLDTCLFGKSLIFNNDFRHRGGQRDAARCLERGNLD